MKNSISAIDQKPDDLRPKWVRTAENHSHELSRLKNQSKNNLCRSLRYNRLKKHVQTFQLKSLIWPISDIMEAFLICEVELWVLFSEKRNVKTVKNLEFFLDENFALLQILTANHRKSLVFQKSKSLKNSRLISEKNLRFGLKEKIGLKKTSRSSPIGNQQSAVKLNFENYF